MTNRYEIQCPNCGGALVVPADTDKECSEMLQMFHESGGFHCPACHHNFRGLTGKDDKPWGVIVDKNGSRFERPAKLLDEIFQYQNSHQYLTRGPGGAIFANTESEGDEG